MRLGYAMGKGSRILRLDMLRGFAIWCVVFAHPIKVPSDIELWIYSFHMPLFFMISGATFRFEKYDSLKGCIVDQAKKLLLPYACLYVVSIPFWYLSRVVFGSTKYVLQDQFLGILFAEPRISPMPNGALWFLPALFLTTVFYWYFNKLSREKRGNIVGYIVLCFLIGTCMYKFKHVSWVWHIQSIPMMIVFYHLGHEFIDCLKRTDGVLVKVVHSRYAALIAILAIAIGTWAAFANGKISMYGNQYKTVFLALLSSCGIGFGLSVMFMNLPIIRLFDYAGKRSLIFFGFHVPIMRFLENWDVTEVFFSSRPLWVALATVLILYPVAYIVDRWLPFLVGKGYRKREIAIGKD